MFKLCFILSVSFFIVFAKIPIKFPDTYSLNACENFCTASGGGGGQLLEGAHCLCQQSMTEECSLTQCLKHCHKCGEQYIMGSCFQDNCFCASHDNL